MPLIPGHREISRRWWGSWEGQPGSCRRVWCSKTVMCCALRYCTVLNCMMILHCAELYDDTALCCSVWYYTVLQWTILYFSAPYHTVLCCTEWYCPVRQCTILHCAPLNDTALCCTVWYCTVSVPYFTLLQTPLTTVLLLYLTVLYCLN